MKKTMQAVILACAMLLMASAAFAQGQPQPQQPQPAPAQAQAGIPSVTVDFNAVLVNSQAGQAALKKLEDTFGARQKQLADEDQALGKLKKELDPNLKGPKYKEFMARAQKLQAADRQLTQEIGQARAAVLNPLREKAMATVVAFAREKGIHQVMDRNSLVYADPAFDITAAVIQRMNAQQ